MPESPAPKQAWHKPTARRVAVAILVVLLVPYAFSRVASPWRCISVHSLLVSDGKLVPDTSDSLRILTYNIAHGRGLADSNWGESTGARLERLEQLAVLLRDIDADVVVLNEVDFDSSWSHSSNQARYLAEYAGYSNWAEQRNLDFRVLFWKWRFGNAILSKRPIARADLVSLPGYATWETLWAGKKQGLQCDIQHGDKLLRVIAVHLESRGEETRVHSAQALAKIAQASELPIVIAGDLNATPPGFPGTKNDLAGENTMAVLDRTSLFQRLPEQPPQDASEFTFHSARPHSVIDWILVPRTWQIEQFRVGSSQLSDHRPVSVDVVIK